LITLRFANGAIGHIEGSWAFPAGTFRTFLEIAGSEGVLQHDSLQTTPLTVLMHADAAAEGGKVTVPGGMIADEDDPYYRELKHFLDCLETGQDFLVAPEDGLAALKVALAAIESVRTGRVVELESFQEAK
jgi:predicted dehydrogenase